MEGEVPRASAPTDVHPGRSIGVEPARDQVEPVRHDTVQAEVRAEGVPVLWADHDRVRVRRLLPIPFGRGHGVPNQIGSLIEPAVGQNGQGRHAAARLIGDKDPISADIHAEMAVTRRPARPDP